MEKGVASSVGNLVTQWGVQGCCTCWIYCARCLGEPDTDVMTVPLLLYFLKDMFLLMPVFLLGIFFPSVFVSENPSL